MANAQKRVILLYYENASAMTAMYQFEKSSMLPVIGH